MLGARTRFRTRGMSIRVQLPSNRPPAPKADAAFSSDRAAALSRLVKPGTNPGLTPAGTVEIRGTTPAMPVPARLPTPVALKRAMPSATNPGLPAPPPAPAVMFGRFPAAAAAGAAAGSVAATGGIVKDPARPETDRGGDSSPTPGKKTALAGAVKWGAVFAVGAGLAGLAWYFLAPAETEAPLPKAPVAAVAKPAAGGFENIKAAPPVEAKRTVDVAPATAVVAPAKVEVPVVSQLAPVPPPQAPPPVAKSLPAPKPVLPVAKAAAKDTKVYEEVIGRLKLGAIVLTPEARVVLDGRSVQFGDIVNRELAIRFMGVDAKRRMLLFTNADNVQFRLPY